FSSAWYSYRYYQVQKSKIFHEKSYEYFLDTSDRRDRHSSRRLLRRLSVADETDPAVEEAREFERESLREDGTFLNDRLAADTRNRLEDIYPDLQAVSDRLNSPSKRLKTPVDVKSRDRREEEQYDDVNCGGSEEGNLRDCYYDNGAKSSAERSRAATLEDASSYAGSAAPVKRSSSVAQARKKSKKKPKKHKSKHNVAIKHKAKEKTRHKGKPKKHTALTSSARINPLSRLTETNKCATAGGAREKVKSVKSNAALANARKTAASKHTVIISTSGNSHSNNHNDVNDEEEELGVVTTSTESPACSDPNWTSWTACSVTCGRGIETRTRGCLDEGHVLATEERLCQMPDCPQKLLYMIRC
ncbi:unnamed protein product, partial [Trichogramma brassicae]